jgi:hypothetical protein
VKGDVLIERNHAIQRRSAQERDHVPADREEDEDDVDVQDLSGTSGNDWGSASWICVHMQRGAALNVYPKAARAPARLSFKP